jgi:hypothetical protein
MRNLTTICIAGVLCLGATSGAQAQSRPGAAARVQVPPTPLIFTDVPGSAGTRLAAKLDATVISNHPYYLGASFRGLTQVKGKQAIPPQQTVVKINGRLVPVGAAPIVIGTGGPTSVAGVKVPVTVEIEFKNGAVCPAGQYSGGLTLYIK